MVISMLMFNNAVKQSNYWMVATLHQLSYWICVQLMSAEQPEYWHWVNEHFGKLRLTKKKDCLHSKDGQLKRWAYVKRSLYYMSIIFLFSLSSKAAGQCEKTYYRALHGLSHWNRVSCCTECWWVGVRATNCRKVKGEKKNRQSLPLGLMR